MTSPGMEVLSPTTEEVVLSTGERVTVRPVVLRQLSAFAAAVAPIANTVAAQPPGASEAALLVMVLQHGDSLAEALTITTSLPEDRVGELGMDDTLALALAVFRVNKEVFLKRLLPMLQQALAPTPPAQ